MFSAAPCYASSPVSFPATYVVEDVPKNPRFRPTAAQRARLEKEFTESVSLGRERRITLAQEIHAEEQHVKNWFSNRRAKERVQRRTAPYLSDHQVVRKRTTVENTPFPTPTLSPALEIALEQHLHESLPVTTLPCFELSIGTWHRQANPGVFDLVAYYSATEGRLTHFLITHDSDYAVKMEIPFSTIKFIGIKLESRTGNAQLIYELAAPPSFYLETYASTDASIASTPVKHSAPEPKLWTLCQDWTEDKQGSTVLRHTLSGPAEPLLYFLSLVIGPAGATASSQNPCDARSSAGIYDACGKAARPGTRTDDNLQVDWDCHDARDSVAETGECFVTVSPRYFPEEMVSQLGGAACQLPAPGHPILSQPLGPEPSMTVFESNATHAAPAASAELSHADSTVCGSLGLGGGLDSPYMPTTPLTPILMRPTIFSDLSPTLSMSCLTPPFTPWWTQDDFSQLPELPHAHNSISDTDACYMHGNVLQDAYASSDSASRLEDLEILACCNASPGISLPEDETQDLSYNDAW